MELLTAVLEYLSVSKVHVMEPLRVLISGLIHFVSVRMMNLAEQNAMRVSCHSKEILKMFVVLVVKTFVIKKKKYFSVVFVEKQRTLVFSAVRTLVFTQNICI